MKKLNVVVFGCRFNTLDFLNFLDKKKFVIKKIITINSAVANKNKVSGYINLSSFKEYKKKILISDRYDLKDQRITNYFKNKKIDLGISIGWQRIVPLNILDSFKRGVLGMHCSYLKLPNGKGRSPINWTIIKGYKYLFVHIFKYTAKFDEGPILFRKKILIHNDENIFSIQQKLSIIFSVFINNLKYKNLKNFIKKNKYLNKIIYFKKRTEDSGLIELKKHTVQSLCNFVRAQTHPYPGAYFFYKNKKYPIWSAKEIMLPYKFLKNDSIFIFNDLTFVFKIKNKNIHITEHEIPKKLIKEILNVYL